MHTTAQAPFEVVDAFPSSTSASSASLGNSVTEAAIADLMHATTEQTRAVESATQAFLQQPTVAHAGSQAAEPAAAALQSSLQQTELVQRGQAPLRQTSMQTVPQRPALAQAAVQVSHKETPVRFSSVQTDAPTSVVSEAAAHVAIEQLSAGGPAKGAVGAVASRSSGVQAQPQQAAAPEALGHVDQVC